MDEDCYTTGLSIRHEVVGPQVRLRGMAAGRDAVKVATSARREMGS